MFSDSNDTLSATDEISLQCDESMSDGSTAQIEGTYWLGIRV